jgi:hypothetical protein
MRNTCIKQRNIPAVYNSLKVSLLEGVSIVADAVSWTWRQQIPPKNRNVHTRLHGVIWQKILIFIVTVKLIPELVSRTNFKLDVPVSVHHSTIITEKPNKMQEYIKIYYSIFIWSSTCCWRLSASSNHMSNNLPPIQNQKLLV